jgi:hypothetical protein
MFVVRWTSRMTKQTSKEKSSLGVSDKAKHKDGITRGMGILRKRVKRQCSNS